MSTYGTEYVETDWPHGLRCADCDKLLGEGDRYASKLDSFIGDVPVVLIVCLECALAVEDE